MNRVEKIEKNGGDDTDKEKIGSGALDEYKVRLRCFFIKNRLCGCYKCLSNHFYLFCLIIY